MCVQFNRPKSIPLGLNVAGGCDMPQRMVHIHSIIPGSLADRCNQFRVGDEIVMAGNDLMVGLTWKSATDKINQLVGLFKIVAQRKDPTMAKVEEKQQKEVENGSDSFDSDDDDESEKKGLPTIMPTSNSQSSPAAGAVVQQHNDNSKVTSSIHAHQPTVDEPPVDKPITYTVKVRVNSFIF